MTDELRLDAYYYRFNATGVPEIDLILSAVACAGKAFHYTQQWTDELEGWYSPPHTGNTPEAWIQNAADKAASALAAARREGMKEGIVKTLKWCADQESYRTRSTDLYSDLCEALRRVEEGGEL